MSSVNVSASKQIHLKAMFSSTENILENIIEGILTKLPSVCLLPIQVDDAQFTLLKLFRYANILLELLPSSAANFANAALDYRRGVLTNNDIQSLLVFFKVCHPSDLFFLSQCQIFLL